MPARQRKRAHAEEVEAEPDEQDSEEPETPRKGTRSRRSRSREITATEAARAGVREVTDLTEKKALGVTLLERSDNGWLIGVEVLEDSRIPSAADVLAEYEAEIDLSGSLVSIRRTQRYQRGRGSGNGR